MRSMVVYESMYGNTEAIAQAIADGLAEYGESVALTTGDVDPAVIPEVDLLVVGCPTHAWGLPRLRTWTSTPTVIVRHGPLVRSWLETLDEGRGRHAAAFTTRLDKPRLLTGSAAPGVARRLRHRGWSVAVEPQSFVVTGTEGPLVDAEIERARTWARDLGRVVAERHSAAA